jgi:hypothetical protein
MLHNGRLVVPGGCLVLSVGLQPTDVFTPPEAPLRITKTVAFSTNYAIYNQDFVYFTFCAFCFLFCASSRPCFEVGYWGLVARYKEQCSFHRFSRWVRIQQWSLLCPPQIEHKEGYQISTRTSQAMQEARETSVRRGKKKGGVSRSCHLSSG